MKLGIAESVIRTVTSRREAVIRIATRKGKVFAVSPPMTCYSYSYDKSKGLAVSVPIVVIRIVTTKEKLLSV